MPSNRGLPLRRCCAWFLLANLACFSPAAAKRTPAQLAPTFNDSRLQAPANAEAKAACTVNFVEILDERRSPELIGVVEKRAVRAPTDTQAWMKAVLGGLNRRGVKVKFDPNAAVQPGVPIAKFMLQTAWIASSVVTNSANVVVKLEAQGESGKTLDQTYRGRASRTTYWSGGVDTLQRAVDGAFADALDTMAADLGKMCSA